MAFALEFLERVQQAGVDALRPRRRQAEVARDLVGRLEAHALDLAADAVGLGGDDLLRVLPVGLDDAQAEIWSKEIQPLLRDAERVSDAIVEAYSVIFDAAEEFDESCQNSKHFKDLTLTEDLNLDNSFENIANTSKVEISEKIDEIFEVQSYQ